jgi:multidrug efflux pump subunit AcrA (membrane-fusion protein)
MLAVDDKINVFVIGEDGLAKKTAITIGYQEGNVVEVVDGLNPDDKIVVTGHQNLKDNATVEIVNG